MPKKVNFFYTNGISILVAISLSDVHRKSRFNVFTNYMNVYKNAAITTLIFDYRGILQ